MARFGFGTRRVPIRPSTGPVSQGSLPVLMPDSRWAGAAGSGFASLPVDPVRISAKPVCRLIVLPNVAFSDSLLVGVYAGANDGGSLLDTMGLEKVTFHYEGTSVDVSAPSFQSIEDVNGNPVTSFGWWVQLQRTGDGIANLYVEAVPRDTTMQNRVIGPYVFLPRASLYDHDLTVAPSMATIAGSRYPSIASATNYLRTLSFDNARITLTEVGVYNPNGGFGLNMGQNKGRVVIEASVPVTIRAPAPAANDYWIRPKCEPICWQGDNITIDFNNCAKYLFESAYANHRNAFNGCRLTNSNGRDSLFLRMPHAINPTLLVGNQWLTDVTISGLANVATGAQLLRGATCSQTYADFDCFAFIDTTIDEHDSRWHTAPIDALTLTYSGAGATATIEKSMSGFNYTFTAKVDGATVGTFVIAGTYNAAIADTQFRVSHVAAWINTLSGWSAATIDDTRAGHVLSTPGGVAGGVFAATNVKDTQLTLRTGFDVHGDINQIYNAENIVMTGVIVTDSDVQDLFFKDGFINDALVINNAFDNVNGNNSSQFADLHSHVVVAHNSWSKQGFVFRTDFTGARPAAKYNGDVYCLFANNVCPTLIWGGGLVDADVVVVNNHLLAGASQPPGATGTTQGGTFDTLFADAPSGDFTPAGDLLTNLAAPIVRYDREGTARANAAPKGAIGSRL